jgi:hypothetical protein
MDTGFKFQVRGDGRVVVGVTKVSALKRSTESNTERVVIQALPENRPGSPSFSPSY